MYVRYLWRVEHATAVTCSRLETEVRSVTPWPVSEVVCNLAHEALVLELVSLIE